MAVGVENPVSIASQQATIEKLQRVESDLREGQEFAQAMFDASQAGMVVVNTDLHQIMEANTISGQILGLDKDDLVGAMINDFIPPANEGVRQAFLATGLVRDQEIELIHSDGHKVPIILSVTRIGGPASNMALLSFIDITTRKEAELELLRSREELKRANEELKTHKDLIVQSEKLASIGQLAAGVAHEINNPVGFVTSNLGTIQEYVTTMGSILKLYDELEQTDPSASDQREALQEKIRAVKEEEDLEFILDDLGNVLEESMDGVKRVTEIVQNLKSFARQDSQERRPLDINEGIESMIKMVWNELKYTCEVERDFGEVPLVQCHPGQINQVVMNMLVNASHAMGSEGGTITVGTRATGNEVEIRISDTGSGIPEEIRNRIFDPFFTTKDVGKGTGLGLSISHGIIQDHGGRIEVDSEVGKGTTFRIYLPLGADKQEGLIG